MLQPIVYFDIDHTLYDTRRLLNESIFPQLEELCATNRTDLEDTIADFYELHASRTDIDVLLLLRFLSEQYSVSLQKLVVLYETADFKSFVYPQIIETLQQLQSKNCTLGILSEGVLRWQQHKLQKAGLIQFFEPERIQILRRKENPQALHFLNPQDIVIDDKPSMCQQVVATGTTPILALWRYSKTEQNQMKTHFSDVATATTVTAALQKILKKV